MNKKNIMALIAIVIVAILLRLWNLDKPEGMWNDEYLTWQIANAKFPFDFFQAIKSNCHAPLHYFYLKGWMMLFKDADYSLRLSSLVPGVISVIVMFFVGNEFKGKKDAGSAGLACAFFTAISSFLIYFSQEVRIYSLTFMITAFLLLFAVKILNNPSKKNFAWYGIFSLLLMLEHTIGFVFVFFSTFALFVFTSGKKKKDFALYAAIGVFVLILPLIPFLYGILAKQSYFSQWWAPFSSAKLAFFFTDLLSPVLNNITNAPPKFMEQFYRDGVLNIGNVIFCLTPTLLCLICAIRGLFKPKNIHFYLLSVFVSTFLTVLIAALMGKIIFLTKYIIELYPILILLVVLGWMSFKSRGLRISFATIFAVVSLFYLVVANTSAVKLIREEGQRIPIVALSELGLKKNDKILFLYYPKDRFDKYIGDSPNYDNTLSVNKYNFSYFMISDTATTEEAFLKGKEIYKPVFLSDSNPHFDNMLNQGLFSSIKRGDKLFIVDLYQVSFFPENDLKRVVMNENTYQKVPFLYLVTSYVKNFAIKKAEKNMEYLGYKDNHNWRIYIFEKV